MLKLKDLLNTSITGQGLFTAMNNPIWANDFDSSELDTFFILNYGDRIASPYLLYFKNANNIIEPDNVVTIANLIYSVRKSSWEHLYKAYTSEYNPIHNVDATIEITEDNTHSDNRTTSDNTTESGTSTTSSNASGSNSTNTNNTTSGFNSSGYVPDNASNSSGNTGASSSSNATNSSTTGSNGTDSNAGEYSTVRSERRYGNIGVTSSSQLVTGEKNLWQWDFMKSIYEDICDMIALSIYE